MAAMFQVGEKVEIFSNSQGRWVPGTIIAAPTMNCLMDGYSVQGGAVKVQHDSGTKWVMPDLIPRTVRKCASTSPAPTGGYTGGQPSPPLASPAAVSRCKFGCGRPVQPGLTKGLQAYDTCCKTCAITEGKEGKHDENCGRNFSRAATRHSTLSLEVIEVRKRLKAWADHPHVLASEIRERAASSSFTKDSAKACCDALFKPLGATFGEEYLSRAFQTKIQISSSEFEKICSGFAKSLYDTHFVPVLKLSTADFVQRVPKPLLQVYTLGEKLGEGSFGSVYRVTHNISRESRVVKRIKTGDSPMEAILSEIESMAKLDHPNVIKVYEYFDDSQFVSQIMEPCNGGELQERIDAVFKHRTEPLYKDDFIRSVMKQTLRALAFMHSQRFAHKDLKPQNIMIVEKNSFSIKVIDFGLAELFNPRQATASFVGGTLLYMAPEVFDNELTFKSDVWSAGVVLYNLTTGGMPFCGQWPPPPGRDQRWWESETQRIIRSEPMAPNTYLSSWSAGCRSTLESMLTKYMDGRPEAAACLGHGFYNEVAEETPTLSVGVVQCLECYSRLPELKQAIFLLMAHQSSAPALEELRAIFTYFDVANEGTLSDTDLRKVLTRASLKPLYVDKVIHTLDRDGDGKVSWTEFTAAALCVRVCHQTELVDAAFSHFDANSDGKIDMRDLERVLAKSPGEEVQWKQRLPNMIAEFRSTTITKDEFRDYVGSRMDILSGHTILAVG